MMAFPKKFIIHANFTMDSRNWELSYYKIPMYGMMIISTFFVRSHCLFTLFNVISIQNTLLINRDSRIEVTDIQQAKFYVYLPLITVLM
jgi:hypothetical protein